MNLTVKFKGHVADVIDALVERGIVSTKTEALRLGVLKLEQEYLKEEKAFDNWALKESKKLDKPGKRFTEKEFEKEFGVNL